MRHRLNKDVGPKTAFGGFISPVHFRHRSIAIPDRCIASSGKRRSFLFYRFTVETAFRLASCSHADSFAGCDHHHLLRL